VLGETYVLELVEVGETYVLELVEVEKLLVLGNILAQQW
jgi:hypothetical protein